LRKLKQKRMSSKSIRTLFDKFVEYSQPTNDRDSNVLIIDGLNTFIRLFAVVPQLNEDGMHVGGTMGFLRSIGSNIRQFGPTRCIVVFDGKGGSYRRRKVYPDYKANRKVKRSLNRHDEFKGLVDEQQSMRNQLMRILEYLDCLPVTFLSIDNIEADDTIAYITKQYYSDKDNRVTIVSSDRDFIQLVDPKINIWSPVKKKLYTPHKIVEEFGLHPKNYLLYRVLTGDKSDNIPGVKGVGLKTLKKRFPFINNANTEIEDLIEYSQKQINEKSKVKLYKTLVENEDILLRNDQLMQLTEVDISSSAKLKIQGILDAPITSLDKRTFKHMFLQDKLYSIVKDVDSWLFKTFTKLNTYAKKTS